LSSAAHEVIAQLQQARTQLEAARTRAFGGLQLLDKTEELIQRAVGRTVRAERILAALRPRHAAIKSQILAINPLIAAIDAAIASIQGGGKSTGAPPPGPA
jgi:hypothetical protein